MQLAACASAALLWAVVRLTAAGALQIYFVDVEGGQATLVVLPTGQTLMIDAGFAGDGTFRSTPGDPAVARDAQRIAAAAHDAGVSRIDYLLVTHFHADHDGGVPELAQLLPIGTFIDHGGVEPAAEQTVGGTLNAFDAYTAVRAKGRHLEPTPGDRLPIDGVEAIVLSGKGITIDRPLSGAGQANAACAAAPLLAQEPNENPRSTGILLQFGRFRFLDVGDLSGAPLFKLACPDNLIGDVDVYLVAHHGNADAADPATFAGVRTRAAIVNNGARKGGAAQTLKALQDAAIATWQLHTSTAAGMDNVPPAQIANIDDTTSNWIKVTARDDGSFDVENKRTSTVTSFPVR
jgi:beta-lactamase superfamily II metal-dependent hydrolase